MIEALETAMTVHPILRYPDPLLARKCAPVLQFDERLKQLCDDLLDTMRAAPGVGITAAHIGVDQRISIIQLAPDQPIHMHINPEILSQSPQQQRFTEGSVSMPGMTEDVERAAHIHFRFHDLDGNVQTHEAEGFLATCIQHEVDQLDGIFWIKRLSRLKRDRLLKRWEKQTVR